jgi:hypothetical protein
MPQGESEILPLTQAERDEILAIFIRLPENDSLRKLAPPTFGYRPQLRPETTQVAARLWDSETQWRARAFAAWTLGRMTLEPEEKHSVAKSLRQLVGDRMRTVDSGIGSRIYRAWKRTAIVTIISIPAAVFLFSLLRLWVEAVDLDGLFQIFFVAPIMGALLGLMLSFCLFPLMLPFSAALDLKRNNFVRATAITALGRLCVPETVGVLAQAWTETNGRVRHAAEPALMAVLPTLTEAHYAELPSGTIIRLCGALYRALYTFPYDPASPEYRRHEILILLLLDALGKVGDGQAVPVVSEMAEMRASDHVRQKALEILPILQERQEQERAKEVLLRAASAPETPSEELLRPATATAETAPQQLLQPSSSES